MKHFEREIGNFESAERSTANDFINLSVFLQEKCSRYPEICGYCEHFRYVFAPDARSGRA